MLELASEFQKVLLDLRSLLRPFQTCPLLREGNDDLLAVIAIIDFVKAALEKDSQCMPSLDF